MSQTDVTDGDDRTHDDIHLLCWHKCVYFNSLPNSYDHFSPPLSSSLCWQRFINCTQKKQNASKHQYYWILRMILLLVQEVSQYMPMNTLNVPYSLNCSERAPQLVCCSFPLCKANFVTSTFCFVLYFPLKQRSSAVKSRKLPGRNSQRKGLDSSIWKRRKDASSSQARPICSLCRWRRKRGDKVKMPVHLSLCTQFLDVWPCL